jgi:hypothetical protein
LDDVEPTSDVKRFTDGIKTRDVPRFGHIPEGISTKYALRRMLSTARRFAKGNATYRAGSCRFWAAEAWAIVLGTRAACNEFSRLTANREFAETT